MPAAKLGVKFFVLHLHVEQPTSGVLKNTKIATVHPSRGIILQLKAWALEDAAGRHPGCNVIGHIPGITKQTIVTVKRCFSTGWAPVPVSLHSEEPILFSS